MTMAGSLYYSMVAEFVPCELCWAQRICLYPLAIILLVAALRRDRKVWTYVVPSLVDRRRHRHLPRAAAGLSRSSRRSARR